MLKVVVIEKKIVLGDQFVEMTSLFDRLRGLMFKDSLGDSDGIMIDPCNSIHTFFMRFPIHALFLDKSNKIIKIYENLGPWKVTPIFSKAKKVLEIGTGKDISSLREGDYVEVICLN